MPPPTVQVLFQGSDHDATTSLAYLTGALAEHGCKVRPAGSWRAHLDLPLGGSGHLALARDSRLTCGLQATLTVTDAGDASPQDLQALSDVVATIPLTTLETSQVAADLPILSSIADQAGPRALAGVAVLACIHHMRDFAALLDALIRAGADPALITILDKGYPYRHRHRVDGWLRHRHRLTVFDYPDRVDGIAGHLDRAAAAGTRTLVMDDGGYILPTVLDHYPHRAPEIIGVVEQTSSGIWRLEPYRVPVPVFSVAESALKAAVEAPHVAAAALRAAMSWFPDETWAGRPALVNGYGRLGRHAAEQLRDHHHMRVAVHDTSLAALVTAHQNGFHVATDLATAIGGHQPLLLAGCAGRGGLRPEHSDAFTSSSYLMSMTSRDYEYPLAAWASTAERVIDRGQTGHGYLLPGGVELLVVGDGLPANFHHHESLPSRVIDLVFAALFIGATTLTHDNRHGPGTNVALVDEILAASPASGLYLDRYADDHDRRLAAPDPALCGPYTRSPWTYSPSAPSPALSKAWS